MRGSSPTQLENVTLQDDKPPALVVDAPPDAAQWAAENREALRGFVAEHGSILVRGLGLSGAAQAESLFRSLGSLTSEREGFASRTRHSEGVYSASKWPPNQPMCQHHELSYALEPPGLIFLACVSAPTSGGATRLADASVVLKALPGDLVNRFEQDGWLLSRTYNEEIGASVADAFGTEERDAVERYCRANAIEFEWLPGGTLRTRQRRRAVVDHPTERCACWFNQIAFLNQWTLDPEVREYLVEVYGEEGLPFNTSFGNGDPIGPEIVATINEVYEAHVVREPWQAGDLLIVDNVRTSHGREPYEGERELVVGMADRIRMSG